MPDKKANLEKEFSAITQVLEAYKAAIYEKNINAFMQLYDANARVFDTWNVWIFEGANTRLPFIDAWLGGFRFRASHGKL